MRSYFTFLLAGVLSLSAQAQSFELRGKIKHADHETIYLIRSNGASFYLENQPIELLDSATVINGMFLFKGTLKYPQDVALRLRSGRQFSFILEPGVTYMETDGQAIWTTRMSGSPENELKVQLLKSYEWVRDSVNRYADRYFERKMAGQEALALQDSLRYAFFSKMSDSLKLVNTTHLIQTRPQAFLGLSQLNLLAPEFGAVQSRELLNILQKHFGQHPLFREVSLRISALENRAEIDNFISTLTMPDPKGNVVRLSDIHARFLIVDFWASWCRPCREENPLYRRIYQAFHERGVEIVSVSADVKKASWLKAIEADQMHWRHLSDLQGFRGEAFIRLGIQSIPFNILLDEKRKVIATDLRGQDLYDTVKSLVEKQ